MNSKLRVAALAALLAGGAPLVAWGAGMWSNWPVVGGSSYCSAYNGNSSAQGGITGQGAGNPICAQTVPQGPSATGEEMIPADVYGSNGGQPVISGLLPASSLGSASNKIIGGDFATNLWQRGTTVSSVTTAPVMTADRWWAASAAATMDVLQETGSTDSIPSLGLYGSMRVRRHTGDSGTGMCVGQILDSKTASAFIGNNAVLSFYGYAPSTYSAANSNITVSVAYYTAADSATPGTNTTAFANSGSGQSSGITGYQAAVTGTSPNYPAGVLASGVETIPLSPTWSRYSVYAPIPSVNSSGTAVTGIGITICGSPTLTSAVTTDWFEIEAVQLEAKPSVATAQLPYGVISPSGFQYQLPSDAQRLQFAYSYVFSDGGTAGHGIFGTGWDYSTAAADVTVPFPVPMRETPTGTVATATSFAVFELNGTTTQACSTLAVVANGALTTNQASMTCTTGGTALTADAGTQLTSEATGAANTVTFSAEP